MGNKKTEGVSSPAESRTFGESYQRLKLAQKNSKGAPPYSRFINRPTGRIFAAAAYQLGLVPNQVTAISGCFTFAGIIVLATASPTWSVGIVISVLLMIGYSLDSADGQLARLRGGGSAVGEWLDHMIDSAKLASIHLAMLICMYRFFDLPSQLLLLVPIGFAVVQMVQFFGMILTDLVAREHHARRSPGTKFVPTTVGSSHSTMMTIARLPVDYGLLCLSFVVLGAHIVFFVVYTVMALAAAGYLLLALARWFSLVRKLDRPVS